MIQTNPNEVYIGQQPEPVEISPGRKRWPRILLILVVIACAAIGTWLTLFSSADQILDTSTDPNTIIVQYSMPHVIMPVKANNIAPASYAPFTLYGNGLLVCGHDTSMPFMSNMSMPMDGSTGAPTSKTLTQDEIRQLISEIYGTGFLNLDHEYYKLPIGGNQETLRVNLLSGDHYVLYYRDVPAPQPYLQTRSILEKYCSTATTPYLAEEVTVRSLKDADPKTEHVTESSLIPATSTTVVQRSINNSTNNKATKRSQISTRQTITKNDTASETVSGSEAQMLNKDVGPKQRKFLRQNGSIYELSVDPNLPKPSNPLKIDYNKIRNQDANKSISAKVKSLFFKKTYAAAAVKPVRLVILLPSDGGSTAGLAQAKVINDAVYRWYCQQTNGYCYSKTDVQVITGSQTASYYTTCHMPKPATSTDPNMACWMPDGGSNPLSSILYNVQQSDKGTIYREDMETLLITGWDTKTLNYGDCGRGFVNLPLGVVDYFSTSPLSGASYGCFAGLASAHEMGHNFGLNHTGNGTLMDGSPLSRYSADCDIGANYTVCNLDESQKVQVAANTAYFYKVSFLPAPGSAPSRLNVGQSLYKDQYILSPSGNFMAKMQSDGDLVVYGSGMLPAWSSNTAGTLANYITLQKDGNFVIYAGALPVWNTGTTNYGSRYLSMQDDGNLVLYDAYNQPLWSSKTGRLAKPAQLIQGTPAVIKNSDGRLEVFARGADSALWHIWQTAPNGSWSSWSSLGGVLTSDPAVGRNADGHLEVFVRGTDNALYHAWQTSPGGSWSGWYSFGGILTSDPTVISNSDGRLEVFVKGTDNGIHHLWEQVPNGVWTGWYPLGGSIMSGPVVGRNADGHLEVFARGLDNAMWHAWQTKTGTNNWSGWYSFGGILTTEPAVGTNVDGRLGVYVAGTNGEPFHIYQKALNGSWSTWTSLGGAIASAPGVGRNSDGRLEIYARNSAGITYHNWQKLPGTINGWIGWSLLGNTNIIASKLVAESNQDGHMETFARGNDGHLYHIWQTPNGVGGWSNWTPL